MCFFFFPPKRSLHLLLVPFLNPHGEPGRNHQCLAWVGACPHSIPCPGRANMIPESILGHKSVFQVTSDSWILLDGKVSKTDRTHIFVNFFLTWRLAQMSPHFFFFDGESTFNGLFFYVICSKNGYMYPQLRKSGHRGCSPFSPKFLSTQLPLANFSVQEKLTITEFLNLIYRPNSTCLWESVFLPG